MFHQVQTWRAIRAMCTDSSLKKGHVYNHASNYFAVDYLTNRFHVAVRLFSNRSQMTSKCGKNKKMAHEAQPSVSLMFLPHFDVLCDLLVRLSTAKTANAERRLVVCRLPFCPRCLFV